MHSDKLRQIISDKNDQLERQAVRSAEHIIEMIICEQFKINAAETNIKELRAELVKLSVEELNPDSILGQA